MSMNAFDAVYLASLCSCLFHTILRMAIFLADFLIEFPVLCDDCFHASKFWVYSRH